MKGECCRRNQSDSNVRMEVLQTHVLATWLWFAIDSMPFPFSGFAVTRNYRCWNALGGSTTKVEMNFLKYFLKLERIKEFSLKSNHLRHVHTRSNNDANTKESPNQDLIRKKP